MKTLLNTSINRLSHQCLIKKIKLNIKSKINNTNDNTTHDNTTHDNHDDKYLHLLFNVIKNETKANGEKIICWNNWFKIAGILKSNDYDVKHFIKYGEPFCNENEAILLWNGIKTEKMSIYGLQNIAKEINPTGYNEWKMKHHMKLYKHLFTSGLIADYFNQFLGIYSFK